MDLPAECIPFSNYRATRGHKINHSFAPNCKWDTVRHPVFGRIPRIVTLKRVDVGEELTCHYMIDMTEADRRRIFQLGYYTWVEQQGTPFELFEQRRSQEFWRGLRRYVGVWDEMITELNTRIAAPG